MDEVSTCDGLERAYLGEVGLPSEDVLCRCLGFLKSRVIYLPVEEMPVVAVCCSLWVFMVNRTRPAHFMVQGQGASDARRAA